MRNSLAAAILLLTALSQSHAQQPSAPKPAEPAVQSQPTDPRALKEFNNAKGYEKTRNLRAAVDSYKKALKAQSACFPCAKQGIRLAFSLGKYKDAWEMAEMLGAASPTPPVAVQLYALEQGGIAMFREGVAHNKQDLLLKANQKFEAALLLKPDDDAVVLASGRVLAHLHQDAPAHARFQQFLALAPADDQERSRVQRYLDDPELARARLAPNFRVTTLDGKTLSMDDLQGKVVLLDFWATWCGPCNAELPHVKEIAAKYAGRPLVVLSISWDKDEAKWKDFIAAHGMTWAQFRDSDHQVTDLFAIDAIPHYFTIDTDSVLQTEQLGGGSKIDGKLKKMVAEAEKRQQQQPALPSKRASS
jgi:thiol-disulfide isomerase/thioredoxin